ncbi:FKBP-type peptidyl-prolyl cis-trans isomerase [Sphingobacterium sp. DR205]|uniref:FKBP-type peptidyl-prolyl cis-trans isomerase n=1 Tax=Sphingobacterium sp. DR205 TaxID=2713573 RepID=UPI0013E45EEE|nr:FKBP-type peptidyl-prolyl cis-trans isomerase [Sphingobacterium sp. DR205]QIH36350.1 peptidylprolyl isomerase [Sphingobacterium sp. DR205]
MKKLLSPLFLGIAAIALFTVSCAKSDDTPVYDAAAQFKTDSVTLKNYVDNKFPDAQYDSETGIWYEILTEGEGNYQYKIVDTLNAKFLKFKSTVKYTGRLLSGSIFDQTEADKTTTFEILTNTGYQYPFVSSIIPAWTFAFAPKKVGDVKLGGLTEKGLQKGTKIHIMAPSLYGYQNQAVGTIPANSPLDFVIEVVDLK